MSGGCGCSLFCRFVLFLNDFRNALEKNTQIYVTSCLHEHSKRFYGNPPSPSQTTRSSFGFCTSCGFERSVCLGAQTSADELMASGRSCLLHCCGRTPPRRGRLIHFLAANVRNNNAEQSLPLAAFPSFDHRLFGTSSR